MPDRDRVPVVQAVVVLARGVGGDHRQQLHHQSLLLPCADDVFVADAVEGAQGHEMARNRVRVERGLYRDGEIYYACATPPGGRAAVWKSLGPVGKMEARRRRDELRSRSAANRQRSAPRATFVDMSAEWLAAQRQRVAIGDLRPRTLDIYEKGLRLHVVPELGPRTVASITGDT
jgi:hypothetical protein